MYHARIAAGTSAGSNAAGLEAFYGCLQAWRFDRFRSTVHFTQRCERGFRAFANSPNDGLHLLVHGYFHPARQPIEPSCSVRRKLPVMNGTCRGLKEYCMRHISLGKRVPTP
jgi:hypothetical protein